MADLITAAQTQIKYAGNEFKSGDTKKGQEHLDKATAFLARASAVPTLVTTEDTKAADAPVEWSGTFKEAYKRLTDAATEELIARGLPAGDGRDGPRGALDRQTYIDLATSLGVLDELGGPDFFGPELPGGLA